LANPLSQDMAVLRTSLVPGLVRTVATNLRKQQARIRLYETGHVFAARPDGFVESHRVAISLAGRTEQESWTADRRDIDFYDLKGEVEQTDFDALNADVAVVVAYGLILPQAILDAPKHGCLNIHASLLPRWRGAAPIHRAIMAGDRETGVCIMQMEAGLDTGPVLLRKATEIGVRETTGELHDRLSQMGARAIVEALDRLGDLVPEPQPDMGVTYAEKIDKAEARVNWSDATDRIVRQINGLSPFPGAWSDIGGERIKFLRARRADRNLPAGHISADGGFSVGSGDGAVEILELQRPGRRPAPVSEVLKGWQPPETA